MGHSLATTFEAASGRGPPRLSELMAQFEHAKGTLESLSTNVANLMTPEAQQIGLQKAVTCEQLRAILKARRTRSRFFDGGLFADPAWDILLDLKLAELAHTRISVSSLCIGADVPKTTALRWINLMIDANLILKRRDSHDARRFHVELTPQASTAVDEYFSAIDCGLGL